MQEFNDRFLELLKQIPDTAIESYPTDGTAGWARLQNANKNFTNESSRGLYLANLASEINSDVRSVFSGGQKPYATILTCSDSRVAPEIIFGEGLGLLFVIRVAGNVVEKTTLGTIEYGVHHLGTPLLVIMGHEKCGAVTAAAGCTDFHGGVGQLLEELKPSIDHSCEVIKPNWWKLKDTDPEAYNSALKRAIEINAIVQEEELLRTSPIIKEAVESGKLKTVVAYYNITSGKVEEVDPSLRGHAQEKHKERVEKKKHAKKAKKEAKQGHSHVHDHHDHHEHHQHHDHCEHHKKT